MTFKGMEELHVQVSGKVHFVRVRDTYCSPTLYINPFHNLTTALLKWKVGAWGIQGLPLCPASPQIEYSPHCLISYREGLGTSL